MGVMLFTPPEKKNLALMYKKTTHPRIKESTYLNVLLFLLSWPYTVRPRSVNTPGSVC